MKITDKDISRFQELYRQFYGLEITPQVARLKLLMIVRQMEIVYQLANKDAYGDEYGDGTEPIFQL